MQNPTSRLLRFAMDDTNEPRQSRWHGSRRLACAIAIALALAAAPAHAGALDDARKAGQVGEQMNGYIALVKESATKDVKALVKDINQRRKAKYAKLAKGNGVTLEQIESQMGQKLIEKAKRGSYVQNPKGDWYKK